MAAKNRREAVAARALPAKAARADALRAHESVELRRYRQLLDLAPVGYVATDHAGTILSANAGAAELLGRPRNDLVGASASTLVGPERRAQVEGLIVQAAGGAEWHDEVPFVSTDGGRVRLFVHAVGAEEEILWRLSEARSTDEAELSWASDVAEAARVQRERLSTLLDRLQHGVVAVDSSLRVSYTNSAALAPLEEESPVGRALRDPWPEPSLRTLMAGMFEHHAEPAEARAEVEDGRVYEVLALPALPPDASGEALLVVSDVTARERRQRAEREFIANAAHQLRTPVSAIASAIEVLQGGGKEVPETRDRFLAHLDRQCARLVRLVRALLLLARAQALSEPPTVEIVPLRPVLDSIAGALRPGADVDVRVECPPDVAALANRDLLEQAIGNIAENAATYTVAGEIVLCAEPQSADVVRIVVSDTGPGADFPPDASFVRFHRERAADGDGFGLGLAIAAEAVRAHGGELRMASGPDGTRAYVTLPAARVWDA
jgi:PAS domain S-box-containing protein